jgi:NTE family protein
LILLSATRWCCYSPRSPTPDWTASSTELTQNNSRVEVIIPDENSLTAFGLDPLDPDTRTPAARAGRAQGHQAAITIAELWN